MMNPFLTIAEAAEKTGRSHSTIRRLIRTIGDSPTHVDRAGVEPSPKAVDAFKKKGENFTWKIHEDILLKHLPRAQSGDKKTMASDANRTQEEMFKILQHELDLKNQQIEKQWEVIGALNERLREGNILMGSLQQRLALPSADSPAPITVDEASMEAIHRASKKKVMEVKQKVSKQTPVKASTETPKKGVLSWLFR